MTITAFTRELDISRTQYYAWAKEGMPGPPDINGARHWMRRYKLQRTRGFKREAPPNELTDTDIVGPDGRLTVIATHDFVERLGQFIADGAGKSTHPDHQTMCDGLRLVLKFGKWE